MPDSPPEHLSHTSQPEQVQSNQNTSPVSAKGTQAKSDQGTADQMSEKSQPPGGNKQLFADPSYQLILKY